MTEQERLFLAAAVAEGGMPVSAGGPPFRDLDDDPQSLESAVVEGGIPVAVGGSTTVAVGSSHDPAVKTPAKVVRSSDCDIPLSGFGAIREPLATASHLQQTAQGISDPTARAAFLDRACGTDAELRRQVSARLAAHPPAASTHEPLSLVHPPASKDGRRPIFISYRQVESEDKAEQIYKAIRAQLPMQEVFWDRQSIRPGTNFPELLREKLTDASAVLVIIGPRWLEVLKQRKADPVDYVRDEVRIALESPAVVIPVTIGGARVPSKADLADFPDLIPLANCSAMPVRPEPDFAHDIDRLVTVFADPITSESVGAILAGKYRLLQQVGEGGMGMVFAAQQTHPIRRQVAIKLIKPGMDSKDVLARFDAEKQALAMMDHPNIARVLDADLTLLRRPFFVMELVQGKPITEYCDANKLSPRERLELFKAVCHAVHHAHQKLIIHRDIKPSNVLVAVVDRRPVPKVIDFGVAKVLGPKLTEKILDSEIGQRIGTLEYMSPEQAQGKHFDIDIRSDIYSLGVLLYELLTGNPPFTRQALDKVGEYEMRRLICHFDPPIPSRWVSSHEALPSTAANRNLESAQLTKLLRNELDWIVMKALRKDPTCRYQTALGLAEDVERYLADEVVQARPPSIGYRASKFFRKHRVPVIAAGLVLIALLAGITGTTLGLLRANEARRDALQAAEDALKAKNREAEQLAIAIAQRMIAEKAHLGLLLYIRGNSAEAVEQYRNALAIRKKLAVDFPAVPEYRSDLAASHDLLGEMLQRVGKGEEAEEHYREAMAIKAKLAAEFPNIPEYRADIALLHNKLGLLLSNLGKWSEAEEQYRQALAVQEKLAAEVPETPEYYRKMISRLYDFACFYAIASGKVAGKKQDYADRAIGLLEKAVKAGYPDVEYIVKDTCFDPIRDRDDFKKLLESLSKPKVKESNPTPRPIAPPPRLVTQ